jgi:hypothetical protein
MSTNEFLKEHKYVILGAFGFVILALVIITVGYGCIHAIDAQNAVQRARIEADERAREAETQRKEDEAKAASEAEVKRQGILDACLQDAHELYTLNWNLGCAKLSDSNEKGYKNCVQKYKESGPFTATQAATECRETWPAVPKEKCSLPSSTADRWEQSRKDDEEACYLRLGFKR